MTRRGNRRGWQRVEFVEQALVDIAPFIPAARAMVEDSEIVAAHGFRDRAGVWQRIHAPYANGWRVTASRRKDGSWSSSWALKLTATRIGGDAK